MEPTGLRVLVVEDDPAIQELISLHLRLEGYGVVPSADGREALRLARAEPFDLIVLDIMLPGLDGISILGAIRRDSANQATPILMLTARREETDKVDLLYVLASNRGIVFSREALMRRVWGNDTHITERSVDTLVKRVRRKIDDDANEPRFILTVWGTGYKFADV